MKQILINVALFLGYCLFAAISAYMTANSINSGWLSGVPFFVAYIVAFSISLIAGVALTKIIKEIKNPVNPSKSMTIFWSIIFLVFWGWSFMTNVHYAVVANHGDKVIAAQLHSCIAYLEKQRAAADEDVAKKAAQAQADISSRVYNLRNNFEASLESKGFYGFGDDCIQILKQIENELNSDTTLYKEGKYVIYNESYDKNDRNTTDRIAVQGLKTKYLGRINSCLNRKYDAINKYYNAQKANTDRLEETLQVAKELETQALPQIKDSGKFKDYHDCYDDIYTKLLSKMPEDYKSSIEETQISEDGKTELVKYKIYPSERMFNAFNLWQDWLKGYISDDSDIDVGGKLPWAIIVDVMAFILIGLIKWD